MIKKLTIHLVVKNNEKTIERCIKSIIDLDAEIIVADLGCIDNTIELCNKYNLKIKKVSKNNDMSLVRNNLIEETQTEWILSINPWECIVSGKESIIKSINSIENAYKINILQNDTVSKEIRLWNKKKELKYNNPVYECLYGKFDVIPVYFLCTDKNKEIKEKDIDSWLDKSPLLTSPLYYKACYHLIEKRWDSFINLAEIYIHQQKEYDVPYYMINYYLSMVLTYIKKDYQKAGKHLIVCLAKMPTMAEFWCLYGDIFCSIHDYSRAIAMYENAKIMGEYRLNNDEFPVEISKYKEYPEKMIQSCNETIKSTKLYYSQKQ